MRWCVAASERGSGARQGAPVRSCLAKKAPHRVRGVASVGTRRAESGVSWRSGAHHHRQDERRLVDAVPLAQGVDDVQLVRLARRMQAVLEEQLHAPGAEGGDVHAQPGQEQRREEREEAREDLRACHALQSWEGAAAQRGNGRW